MDWCRGIGKNEEKGQDGGADSLDTGTNEHLKEDNVEQTEAPNDGIRNRTSSKENKVTES